jgi:hypothetical protein
MTRKIKPSDLRREAEELIRSGRMPSLAQVLKVIAETRKDYIVQKMIAEKIPLTQANYLNLAYFGQKISIDDLGPEEIANLPDNFSEWPEHETSVN